jgi:hypothetical protein
MSDNRKLLHDSFSDWLVTLWFALRAGLSMPFVTKDVAMEGDCGIDPDFDGWLHGDPMVTKNPASRYGDRTPGYITGNGLGSMEIGAADD